MRIFKVIILLVSVLVVAFSAVAQEVENNLEYRTYADLSFSPAKKVTFSLTPEFRFNESMSLNEFLVEGGLAYKPVKYVSLGVSYRVIGDINTNKTNDYYSKFGLEATVKKSFGDFTPSFRLKYTNDNEEGNTDDTFFRYKTKLVYDIDKCKFTPFASAEMFQQLSDNSISKMRYSAGVNYKIKKNNYIGVTYKLDYFLSKYQNNHSVSLGYKIKF